VLGKGRIGNEINCIAVLNVPKHAMPQKAATEFAVQTNQQNVAKEEENKEDCFQTAIHYFEQSCTVN